MLTWIFFIVFLTSLKDIHPARILGIIPTASYSHQVFFQQLWRQLAQKGHDVVVITTDPTGEKLPNFREISVQESYAPTKQFVDLFINTTLTSFLLDDTLWKMSVNIGVDQLALPQVQEVLHNETEHFDLLMVELPYPIYMGLKHRFKCSMIGISSYDALPHWHDLVGNPTHSVLYPMQIFPRQSNLNLLERVAAVVIQNFFDWRIRRVFDSLDEVMRRNFGDEVPHLWDLIDSVDMLFINSNPLFSEQRPLTPSTINLAGGLHMRPPEALPKDLKDFLDDAAEGVVYFSLGTNVKSKDLGSEMRKTIIETFRQLPWKVLWKYEDDQLHGQPENVKTIKWAPQQDVLRHKNVKVFVTQGGIQSLEEALYTHVPLVTIPFFGDQQSNAEKVKDKGLGLVLDRYNLNTRKLNDAISEVMTRSKYRENIVRLAGIIQDQPQTAMERAIWWTEYVLRHKGGRHLRGPRIPFYQYYYLDIWVILISLSAILLGLGYWIIKLILHVVTSSVFTKKIDVKPRKKQKNH